MDTPTPETPRDLRVRLNKMERWCERNAAALGPRAFRLRALFEVAATGAHADYLAAELRAAAESLTARLPQGD